MSSRAGQPCGEVTSVAARVDSRLRSVGRRARQMLREAAHAAGRRARWLFCGAAHGASGGDRNLCSAVEGTLGQQPRAATNGGKFVLPGNLDREATKRARGPPNTDSWIARGYNHRRITKRSGPELAWNSCHEESRSL